MNDQGGDGGHGYWPWMGKLSLPPTLPLGNPAPPTSPTHRVSRSSPLGLRLPTLLEGATVLQCGRGAHGLCVHAQVCGHVEEVSGKTWQEVGVVTSSEWA